MVYKFAARLDGGHWSVAFSSAPAEDRTFAIGGRVTFREGEDWDRFRELLLAARSRGTKVIIHEDRGEGLVSTFRAPS